MPASIVPPGRPRCRKASRRVQFDLWPDQAPSIFHNVLAFEESGQEPEARGPAVIGNNLGTGAISDLLSISCAEQWDDSIRKYNWLMHNNFCAPYDLLIRLPHNIVPSLENIIAWEESEFTQFDIDSRVFLATSEDAGEVYGHAVPLPAIRYLLIQSQ